MIRILPMIIYGTSNMIENINYSVKMPHLFKVSFILYLRQKRAQNNAIEQISSQDIFVLTYISVTELE